MTTLFLDCEFTDFDLTCQELISLAIVSDDGKEFYAEIQEFDRAKCTSFVRETVLPLLGKFPCRTVSRRQMREELKKWLKTYKGKMPCLCFDFEGDLHLLNALLIDLPEWLNLAMIYNKIDPAYIDQYFKHTQGEYAHHALYDARALRYAYNKSASC